MTASIEHGERPEVQRLARLLRVEPAELTSLTDVGDDELREFRLQVTDTLFDANVDALRRLAVASKLLPTAVLVKIAELVFTPLLSARLAGELSPDRAIEISKKLPLDVLTKVSVDLDPRRTKPVIAGTPPETVAAISVNLGEREDWLTMGRFVGYLTDEALLATIAKLTDHQILQIAYVTEDLDVTPKILELLGQERLSSIFAAAAEENAWPKLSGSARHVQEEQFPLVTAALEKAEALDSLATAAAEHGLWNSLLPAIAKLPADSQELLTSAAERLSAGARKSAAAAAKDLGLTGKLGPLDAALKS